MKHLLVALLAFQLIGPAFGQAWTDRVRGSWINDPHDPAGVVIASPLGVCAIVVAPTEQPCVKQAATFLAGDIEKLTGKRPPILDKPDENGGFIRLSTAANDDRWEAFSIKTIDNDEVRLTGSNPRGTAFAAYTLAERLGIDPLYHWTGNTPTHHETLVTKAIDFSSGPPTVKYRGMFHDDEDILPRGFEDESGYPKVTGDVPTEWYAKYFETALRLRMNMVAPYTRTHRRYEVQKMASDWGLFYTSHHYDILLSNPFGIKRFGLGTARNSGETWDWLANRDGMLRYWRGGVEENRDLNCIWPVGLRGVDDYGYRFPKDMPEAEQARIFKDVVAEQVRMTKELLPKDKQPLFHWTLYTEMLPKYQAGLLDVPDDVIIVWPDDNDGVMRGLPTKKDKWKHGVYYHLAYLGKPVKQSAHIVSPQRVAEQFRKIVDSGATEYMLVNVSELREFVMEARQIAEICWDAKTALAGDDPAGRYVKWWSREYFDDEGGIAARAYGEYAAMLDTYDKFWLGSEKVHGALGSLVKKFAGQEFSPALPETLPMLEQRLQRYADFFMGPHLHGSHRQFFFDHVELPMRFDYRSTEAAVFLIRAMSEPDREKAWTMCERAMVSLEQLEIEIARAEHPPFEQWYRESWIRRGPSVHNLHRPYRELRMFLSSGGKAYELPDPRPPRSQTATAATTTAPAR